MKFGYDSRAIANRFVDLALTDKDPITIMPLVKFVYFAHGWHLGFMGKPLIRDQVEAWKYGPVVRKVYNAFRTQGIVITRKVDCDDDSEIDQGSSSEIIDIVHKTYSGLPPIALTRLTHGPGTPWRQVRGMHYEPIPDNAIEEYYQKLIKERQGTNAAE